MLLFCIDVETWNLSNAGQQTKINLCWSTDEINLSYLFHKILDKLIVFWFVSDLSRMNFAEYNDFDVIMWVLLYKISSISNFLTGLHLRLFSSPSGTIQALPAPSLSPNPVRLALGDANSHLTRSVVRVKESFAQQNTQYKRVKQIQRQNLLGPLNDQDPARALASNLPSGRKSVAKIPESLHISKSSRLQHLALIHPVSLHSCLTKIARALSYSDHFPLLQRWLHDVQI